MSTLIVTPLPLSPQTTVSIHTASRGQRKLPSRLLTNSDGVEESVTDSARSDPIRFKSTSLYNNCQTFRHLASRQADHSENVSLGVHVNRLEPPHSDAAAELHLEIQSLFTANTPEPNL